MADDLSADIAAINHIAAVPTILEVVCRTTGMGFAAVARVTENRWIACNVRDEINFGLKPGGQLKVETTICDEIRESRQPVVINHVSENEMFCNHPTPAMYGFESYISMPIILPNGKFFGTLCAIDPKPAKLQTPEIIGMFKLFAELIAFHLDAHEQLKSSELNLREERKTSELRDQFIAVLGHDLRNPLSAVSTGAQLLERLPLDAKAHTIVTLIKDSACRMQELIENVLDFARGRLGGGITMNLEMDASLPARLKQVVAELQSSWPDRVIETRFDLPRPIYCDHGRISQLFSNLLGNALTHGTADKPVKVRAWMDAETFTLSISNSAPQISPAAMELLFQPFRRGQVEAFQQGLGLGLYIASQIAHAHGGVLNATSSPEETCFTFTMPVTEEMEAKPMRVLEAAE